MPDAFGLIQAPVQVAATGEAAGDPLLTRFVSFLKAFVNDNGTTAWANISPVVGAQPVKRAFSHNPEEVEFTERDLPALFLWRDGVSTEEWIGDGLVLETAPLTLLWIFPPAQQGTQKLRQSFVNAIAKLVNIGLERGRTPSYVVAGDPDPLASSQGSLIYSFLGAWSLNLTKWRPRTFVEEMSDAKPRRYPALEMTFELREENSYGIDRYSPVLSPDVKVTHPDGSPAGILIVEGKVLSGHGTAYCGVGTAGQTTAAFILGLTPLALTSRAAKFAVNPSATQKIYYAYLTAYGGPAAFTVNGPTAAFSLVSTAIAIVNDRGVSESWTLYESAALGLGSSLVTVA